MGEPIPSLRVAAKAVIINDQNQLLLLRESSLDTNSQVALYGVAGGKLEPGESFMSGLHREIKEETGLTEVEVIKPIYVGEWRPVVRGTQLQIVATFMLCRSHVTEVVISSEHDTYIWIEPAEYSKYPVMKPDDAVIESLIQELKHL